MGFKITDYPAKTTFDDGDLYDVSTYDGVSAYTSEKMTFAQLKTQLNSDLDNLYNADGSLGSARTVTLSASNTLTFDGGLTTFKGEDATASNFSAKFQDSASSDILTIRNDGYVSGSGTINADGSFYQDDNWLIGRKTAGLAVGDRALLSATGTLCTAVGRRALEVSGIRSTAIGYEAGLTSTGQLNVFGGFSCGGAFGSGNNNVGLGAYAMTNISSGDNNVMMGYLTGAISSSAISSSIALGYSAQVNRSNQFVMGANGATVADMHFAAGIYSQSGSYNGYTEVNMWLTNIEAGNTDVSSNLDWVWNGSAGTGTGTGGDHVWKVAPAGGVSASTENAQVEIMRIKNDGNINMSNLPTSSAGLSAGDLWNNSGVLTIV